MCMRVCIWLRAHAVCDVSWCAHVHKCACIRWKYICGNCNGNLEKKEEKKKEKW